MVNVIVYCLKCMILMLTEILIFILSIHWIFEWSSFCLSIWTRFFNKKPIYIGLTLCRWSSNFWAQTLYTFHATRFSSVDAYSVQGKTTTIFRAKYCLNFWVCCSKGLFWEHMFNLTLLKIISYG